MAGIKKSAIHATDQVHEHFLSNRSQVNAIEHILW